MKVPFSIPYFSSSKIITHHFNIDNAQGDSGIVYEIIIGHDLMVQLVLKSDFGRQILEWDETVLHMKGTVNMISPT